MKTFSPAHVLMAIVSVSEWFGINRRFGELQTDDADAWCPDRLIPHPLADGQLLPPLVACRWASRPISHAGRHACTGRLPCPPMASHRSPCQGCSVLGRRAACAQVWTCSWIIGASTDSPGGSSCTRWSWESTRWCGRVAIGVWQIAPSSGPWSSTGSPPTLAPTTSLTSPPRHGPRRNIVGTAQHTCLLC